MVKIMENNNFITLRELLEKSNIIESCNIVHDKNDCLATWRDELQVASDKIKFDKCREASQLGYCCDAHPGCKGCDYYLPDKIYASFGGKLRTETV